ncbi:hypothetical protein F383_26923 [Gossypium arboreum]|uniref:Uncharacterized protein n=1 Tax=Gossypium arboreum TaxID=29729 RepID=A0A0B0PAX2_GOSAR|nr:hypothetical protein F383_26923 [Gossypium arboreum]
MCDTRLDDATVCPLVLK